MSSGPDSLAVHFRWLSVVINGKTCLHPVSGDIAAGELVALMGPTGSGKTTLLNAISNRGPITSGEVWYGDDLAWSKGLRRYVAFVEQDDLVYPALTVRQSLLFSARLRLPGPLVEKERRVDAVLAALRLTKVAHSPIGDALKRGISGGERKRLVIGQEMLTKPKLLCCDEPTSGLDSATATVVMEALRDLGAEEKVAVLSSVHQPNSKIFLLFDSLLLLDEFGVAFRGPTRAAADAFAPYGLPCPAAYSASDWLMEVVVLGKLRGRSAPPSADESKEDVGASAADARAHGALEKRFGPASLPPRARPLTRFVASSYLEHFAAPLSEQLRVLVARTWTEVRPMVFDRNELCLHVGNATMSGLMWFQLGARERDIFPLIGAAFCIPIAWVFFPLLGSLMFVGTHEVMLKKELSVNAFPLGAWFLVHTTGRLVPLFAHSFVFLVIVYSLVDLSPHASVFFSLYAVLALALLSFQSIGLFLSAAVPQQNVITVAMLLVTFCFVFTGFLVPLDNSPLGALADWINPMRYIWILAMHVAFYDKEFACGDYAADGTSYPDSCRDGGTGVIRVAQIFSEDSVSVNRGPGACVAFLVGVFVAVRFLAFRVLKRRMRKHQFEMNKLDAQQPLQPPRPMKDIDVAVDIVDDTPPTAVDLQINSTPEPVLEDAASSLDQCGCTDSLA